MRNTDFGTAYDFLVKIYRDKAYLHVVMQENRNKRVKKIVCGVLDKQYELNYILDVFSDKKIKNNVRPLGMIAAYALRFLKTPAPVVAKEVNETLDDLGKGALKSYFGALIRRTESETIPLPPKSDKRYVEVKYNLPSWLVGMYKKDYPDTFEDMISVTQSPYAHVCLGRKGTEKDVTEADRTAKKTEVGFFVKKNKEIDWLAFSGKIQYIGYGSAWIAECVGAKPGTQWRIMIEVGALRLGRRYSERFAALASTILYTLIGAAATGAERERTLAALGQLLS